jgi:GDPmannose 4,6-dehydratase
MRALIIGISGQDGTILRNMLRQKQVTVYGTRLPKGLDTEKSLSNNHTDQEGAIISEVDLVDRKQCFNYLDSIQPNRILHVGAVHGSSVDMKQVETENAKRMHDCHVLITHNILEWLRTNRSVRLGVALSSQMYPINPISYAINEESILGPQNYYARTKFEAFKLIQQYRETFNLFAIGYILFNHTSIYSKPNFLFNNLAKQIYQYEKSDNYKIVIADANQSIDISDAFEVCEAMIQALEFKIPEDYVIASGKCEKIYKIIQEAGHARGLNISVDDIISSNASSDDFYICGNTARIKRNLGWVAKKSPAQILLDLVKKEVLDNFSKE